jgi:hypothetical protein
MNWFPIEIGAAVAAGDISARVGCWLFFKIKDRKRRDAQKSVHHCSDACRRSHLDLLERMQRPSETGEGDQ